MEFEKNHPIPLELQVFISRSEASFYKKSRKKNYHKTRKWFDLLEKFANRCAYCQLPRIDLTVEHLIPKSKGGTRYGKNIVPVCVPCNAKRGDQPLESVFPEAAKRLKEMGYELY